MGLEGLGIGCVARLLDGAVLGALCRLSLTLGPGEVGFGEKGLRPNRRGEGKSAKMAK